jgi:hypothetical protein
LRGSHGELFQPASDTHVAGSQRIVSSWRETPAKLMIFETTKPVFLRLTLAVLR